MHARLNYSILLDLLQQPSLNLKQIFSEYFYSQIDEPENDFHGFMRQQKPEVIEAIISNLNTFSARLPKDEDNFKKLQIIIGDIIEAQSYQKSRGHNSTEQLTKKLEAETKALGAEFKNEVKKNIARELREAARKRREDEKNSTDTKGLETKSFESKASATAEVKDADGDIEYQKVLAEWGDKLKKDIDLFIAKNEEISSLVDLANSHKEKFNNHIIDNPRDLFIRLGEVINSYHPTEQLDNDYKEEAQLIHDQLTELKEQEDYFSVNLFKFIDSLLVPVEKSESANLFRQHLLINLFGVEASQPLPFYELVGMMMTLACRKAIYEDIKAPTDYSSVSFATATAQPPAVPAAANAQQPTFPVTEPSVLAGSAPSSATDERKVSHSSQKYVPSDAVRRELIKTVHELENQRNKLNEEASKNKVAGKMSPKEIKLDRVNNLFNAFYKFNQNMNADSFSVLKQEMEIAEKEQLTPRKSFFKPISPTSKVILQAKKIVSEIEKEINKMKSSPSQGGKR